MESQETQKLIEKLRYCGIKIKILRSIIDPTVLHCLLVKDKYRGFGADSDPQLAVLKAYSEFIERMEYHQLVEKGLASSSNGFAAHRSFELASRSAINELIERDIFLSSWVTRHPPYWLSNEEIMCLGGKEAIEFTINFAKHGFKFQYGILGINSGITVVIGCISIPGDSSIGFAIDTSASDSFIVAARKVYYSNCYLGSIVINRKKKTGAMISNFTEMNAIEANFEYYLKGENKPTWFFESAKEIILVPKFDINIKFLKQLDNPSLVAVRAVGYDCQHYFAGLPTKNSLNINRIKSIFPDREIFFDLHPLA